MVWHCLLFWHSIVTKWPANHPKKHGWKDQLLALKSKDNPFQHCFGLKLTIHSEAKLNLFLFGSSWFTVQFRNHTTLQHSLPKKRSYFVPYSIFLPRPCHTSSSLLTLSVLLLLLLRQLFSVFSPPLQTGAALLTSTRITSSRIVPPKWTTSNCEAKATKTNFLAGKAFDAECNYSLYVLTEWKVLLVCVCALLMNWLGKAQFYTR